MIEGIIVDAGHGGIDSGALGNNLQEKDLNLRAALYMYKRLKELGIPTKLVRDSDEYLPKDDRIKRIKQLYNNSPNTILISNHMNAGNAEGAEIVYSLKNNSDLADLILNNISLSGQKIRKAYQRRLPENPNKDYYYILRETGNTTPLLVEYGFIDNINDSKRLNNNLEDYVEGVVKALATYLGYNYSDPKEALDYYTVEKNDTLYSISRRFNISVDELKRINNLNSDILSIGQRIYFKERNDDENIYIVQKGDTLYSISKKFNISVDEIKRINNLSNNDLFIGQELIIIEKDIPVDIGDYEIYEVVKGDSLWAIAKKYDIRVNDLIDINNLSNTNIKVGDKLLVPKNKNNNNNIYIVEKGDTLWSISKKLDIPVNELKEINSLTNNLLSIGQTLKTK